jgi:hypothetical protein
MSDDAKPDEWPGEKADEQAAEKAEPSGQVTAVWVVPMWGRKVGHREQVELTDLIRSVAADGRLNLFDERGEPVTVTRPPRPVRRGPGRPERPRAARPAPSKIVRK